MTDPVLREGYVTRINAVPGTRNLSFEGHVHALRTLGGIPRTKVRYDASRQPWPACWG